MPRYFAIKQYWPDLKVAEHEALARIELAMKKLGFESIRIDQNGLRTDTKEFIRGDEAEFCLDLHFITPKVFPGISIGALWNPPDFYELFGLSQSLSNQLSHDLLVAANPRRAKAWLDIVNPAQKSKILQLNHTVPDDFLEPLDGGPTAYSYIGIGWDKTAGQGHRHRDLLEAIAKSNPLKIYGPARLGDNSRPWQGFESYAGELPFDGKSVLAALNKSGVTLALSSASHLASGISSNRLFESIAAGALPVVELELEPPFDISESLFLDPNNSHAQNAAHLNTELQRLQADPEGFKARVQALQARMRDGFTLESQLRAIILSVDKMRTSSHNVSGQNQKLSLNVSDHLNLYAGRQVNETLTADSVRDLSKTNFSFYLSRELARSKQSWVVFGPEADFIDQFDSALLSISSLEDFDVLHFDAIVSSNAAVAYRGTSPQRTLGDQRPIQSFALKVSVLREWLSQPSGLYSIASLLYLMDFDSKSETPIYKHGFPKNPNVRIREDQYFHVSAFLTERDWLTLGAINDFAAGSLLREVKSAFQKSAAAIRSPVVSQTISYKVILSSLAQMPLGEILFYGKKALGMVMNKIFRSAFPNR